LIVRSGQSSDANRSAPKHLRRNPGWIIAGRDDGSSARELLPQTLKITVGRDQDEIMRRGVLQNPAIAHTRKPISKRAFRFREQVA